MIRKCDKMNPDCIDRLARIEGKIDALHESNLEGKKKVECIEKDVSEMKKFMWRVMGAASILTPVCAYFANKLMS